MLRFGITDPNQECPIDVANFSRLDLIKVFKDLKFKEGVEIGVERGYYSEVICQANPDLHLHCVDPWVTYESGHIEHRTPETVEQFYNQAVERLSKYNATIIRKPSNQAVKKFRPNSIDFVYIDGDHGYEAVINDLQNWSTRVRPGGIIAGHDYWGKIHDPYLRVGPAVKLWTRAEQIQPWFTIGRAKTDPNFRKDSVRTFLWVRE
jgi:hypothetical protein